MSPERAAVLDAVREAGEAGASPKELAALVPSPYGSVRFLLLRLLRDGLVTRQERGRYRCVDAPAPAPRLRLVSTTDVSKALPVLDISLDGSQMLSLIHI